MRDRTKQFAIEVIKLIKKLPTKTENKILGNQLLRSGTSVGANTNSAFRARSQKEYKAKLGIVIEETDESLYWLDLLHEFEKDFEEDILNLKKEANELISIFVSLVKKVQ